MAFIVGSWNPEISEAGMFFKMLLTGLAFSFVTFSGRAQAGDPDPTFNGVISGKLRSSFGVYAVALQQDGKALAGGTFSEVGGVPRSGIVRLNFDGSLDATFDPGSGADNGVLHIIVQPDGKILVGGIFDNFNGPGVGLVRLNANGLRDTDFHFSVPMYAYALAWHPSGKIYIAESSRILRLNSDGSVDAAFSMDIPPDGYFGFHSYVQTFLLQADGKLLLSGNFYAINGEQRTCAARINSDGSLDPSFIPEPAAFWWDTTALGLRQDGFIYAAHLTYSWAEIERVDSAGAFDTDFNNPYGVADFIDCIGVQPDGRAIIGGNFFGMAGRSSLARLNNDGSVDDSFSGYVNAMVEAIVIQPDGRIIIGGAFTQVNGQPHSGVARLLGDTPVLEAHRVHGGDMLASWPAAYTNWVLQGTKNGKFGEWETVTDAPVTLNGINYVTNRISGTGRFYRLVKPEGTNQSSLAQ